MDEKKIIEKSANSFLKSFFELTYNDNKILFDNIQNIYILISFLYNNMQYLDVETQDFRYGKRIKFKEATKLIEEFYKSINIHFEFDKIIKDKTFNIIKTNAPEEATFHELTYGNNKYILADDRSTKIAKRKINVYNNGLLTDSIIWVHEISHYKNQPPEKRGEVNDILTELIAFTEELIYTDYLKQIGYEEEATMFNIEEYKNLTYFIIKSYFVIRIALLYFMTKKVSKENYLLLYKDDKDYDKVLEIFDEEKNKNQNIIFLLLHYSVGVISFYNYIEYKKDPKFLEKLKKLNKKIMTDISLEEALKIINIKLDEESLNRILENINIFRDSLQKENKKKKILNY